MGVDDGRWVEIKSGLMRGDEIVINGAYELKLATTQNAAHVGVTSLALMAFLAGGHLPDRGPYGKVLRDGLNFVIDCVGENGYITYEDSRMYSHAFATLFLAEIYGMTHREDVRTKLQKAVDFIVKCQNDAPQSSLRNCFQCRMLTAAAIGIVDHDQGVVDHHT